MASPVRQASGGWLSLGAASQLLGITASTLRRWADQGQVPVFTTPGGHRRFSRRVIEGLIPPTRTRRPPLQRLGGSPDRFAAAYRRARPTASSGAWAARLSETQRNEFREHGQRLLRALLRYLDADGPDEATAGLAQAEAAAAEYGASARTHRLSLTQTVEGFLRFRQPFLSELAAIARRRGLNTREATGLLMDAEAAMDRLLVSVMKGRSA